MPHDPRGPQHAQHPTYQLWHDEWHVLQHAYEGSGGFLDGTYLIPHPREVDYKLDSDGRITTTKLQDKPKYKRRKQIARYEHFAASLVDTLLSYQFSRPITRTIGGRSLRSIDDHPLALWWDDVDGFGTQIDDWIQHAQELAHVYGHVFVLMDRQQVDRPVLTQADQPLPRLVLYTPLDVWDWLVDRDRLLAIKTVDYVERQSLEERPFTGNTQPRVFRIWTMDGWMTLDDSGAPTSDVGEHGFGELPVIVFHGRRRAGESVVGRSSLGSSSLYKDHYNLVSELRELLRAQTFSMLHIGLGENETVSEARSRLGESSGVETIVFSKGGANFIAPPEGPASVYQAELEKVERKMYRAAGIPWESDGRDAESAESRARKSQDLNRRLSMHADEAQRVDWHITRLFYIATFGLGLGMQRMKRDEISIVHPNEFVSVNATEKIDDTKARLDLPMGPTARRIILERAIGDVLEDLDDEDRAAIIRDIAVQVQKDEEQSDALRMAQAQAVAVGDN